MTAEEYITKHWIPHQIWTHLEWPKHQERLRICAEQMKGYSFVDVGCACGHSTEIMHYFKKGGWAGIDHSITAITKAKEWFPEREKDFYFCNSFNYKEETNQIFDSAVCSEVIEHVDDDRALLNGLLRLVKYNIVITTPDKRVSDPGHRTDANGKMFVYDESSLLKLLRDCNVEKFKIRNKDNFWYVVIYNDKK